jgi:hypothetical protein
MAMHVTNLTSQDYWFGPLHLPGGGAIDVDDTDDTSLYLNDDSVADAINTLYASNKIQVTGYADPFPRATGTPEVLHGDGSPEGVVFAGQGSVYLRRDSGSIYTKKTGIHVNTGWASIAQGAITTTSPLSGGPPSTPNDGDIWIASGVDSNGARWQFQYDANEGTANKWKFIGGASVGWSDYSTVRQNTLDSTWQQVPGSSTLTVARGGVYKIELYAMMQSTSSQTQLYAIGFGSAGASTHSCEQLTDDGASTGWSSNYGADDAITITAGTVLYPSMWSTQHGSTAIENLGFRITPVKVA